MRVLWISPIPLPAVCQRFGFQQSYGGWWILSLLRELSGRADLELAVAWAHRDFRVRERFTAAGVDYFVFPDPGRIIRGGGFLRRVDDESGYLFSRGRDRRRIAETVALVEDFEPDLVHVFGTESCHGLVAPLIRPPLVIWMQGILDVYRHHFFGGLSLGERLRHPRNFCSFLRMTVDAAREREIYRNCRHFIGRTAWDAAHQSRLQPGGRYYEVEDGMRPEFLAASPWRREAVREMIIYTTTSASWFKGTDILIRAIALLRARFPEIRLQIAGLMPVTDPCVRRLKKLGGRLGLSDRIEFLGQLEGVEIVGRLQQARAFVLPSFIENNPNSLAEAQLAGVPVVAAFVGGVPEMVVHEETGLLFQAGDSAALAGQIARLLENDLLAIRLAHQGHRLAHERHSPSRIAASLLHAYHEIRHSAGHSEA